MEQNLSSYKIFYEVARCGNISRAAKELYISQPAISKSVVKLEENLGIRLFNRNSRGVSLTVEGEVLFSHIRHAFEAIDTAEAELRRMKDFNIGHITIGVSATLCRQLLLPYLKRFIESYPNIWISIDNKATAHTIQALEERQLDLGLIAEGSHRSELALRRVQQIHDVFVATPAYLENLYAVNGKDCNVFEVGHILLLDQDNMTRRHIDDFFRERELEPAHTLEVTNMDLLIEFAKIGMGIASVIREFVQAELDAGQLIELPLSARIPPRNISFAYHSGNNSKALRAFLSILDEMDSTRV